MTAKESMPKLMDKRAEDRFLAAYERYQSLNGTTDALSNLSRKAIERFVQTGFPGRKNESWKYTNVTPVINRPYQVAGTGQATAKGIEPLDAYVVVLVNGCFAPEQSTLDELPLGVSIESLSAVAEHDIVQTHLGSYADYAQEPFTALNTAFVKDGVVVTVAPEVTLDRPVHIIDVVANDQPTLLQPRTLIHVADGASVQILHSTEFADPVSLLINAVTEIRVGSGANVDYLDLQVGISQMSRVTNLSVYQ
ncbi:MAG: Fe-S cluster assembly protein SufD, partial [Rhodothermaceae bacterium]|nr:Fe-S cluster assembly protein SufD [Rhodothermaceae bacterium]